MTIEQSQVSVLEDSVLFTEYAAKCASNCEVSDYKELKKDTSDWKTRVIFFTVKFSALQSFKGLAGWKIFNFTTSFPISKVIFSYVIFNLVYQTARKLITICRSSRTQQTMHVKVMFFVQHVFNEVCVNRKRIVMVAWKA